jgi:hypothetical protein
VVVEFGVVGAPVGGWGRTGNHDFPLAWRVVLSMIRVAVAFPDDSVAVTFTVSPVFTLAMPDSPPFTLVDESTVKVPDVPSALFTVSDQVEPDVLFTADTVPVLSSIVS